MTISGNWSERRLTRAQALGVGGAALAALALDPRDVLARHTVDPYGPLVPHPEGNIALPRGFQYRIISEAGKPMSDGKPTPGDPDGMVAVRGPRNVTVLIRNHELGVRDQHVQGVVGNNPYRGGHADERGGTTAIEVSPNRRNVRDYVTSSGTRNNCAGGGTPWGTWLTCEEDREERHGLVFEVRWDVPEGPLTRDPIEEMGFFSHEAVDIDPRTGIAYLTEDDFRGQLPSDVDQEVEGPVGTGLPGTRRSFLYRYLPNDRSQRPGALQAGGELQALKIDEAPRNADLYAEANRFVVRWVTVDPANAPEHADAQGCVRFNRLEGCYFDDGAYWFDDTAGGEARLGQVFRYFPATNTLELFFEGTDENQMEAPDNVVITPWGDLWFAEDGDGENRVMGITPEGHVYKFASTTGSEFAGPTFAPDGQTFFLNAQDHGLTYAIWGPFARQNRLRRRQMAHAAPPAHLGPRISGELREAAERYGMTGLEAAAFDRLGVPLVN